MSKEILLTLLSIFLIAFINGCAATNYTYRETLYTQEVGRGVVLQRLALDPLTEDKILALDPEHITEKDIKEALSHAPAPRIINLHGGIYPVYLAMESFSQFLKGMGYPETKIRNPRDGSYSYSCYENSEKLAGLIAWYYEKEGMRPILIGHSQGGIQTVKVLHELAGSFTKRIPVWNPLTEKAEDRYSIVDPVTGAEQKVMGMQVSYASAVGAGGFTRFLPNQWNMFGRLRTIPDTVIEFTGFYMGLDLLGGDLVGFGSANKYKPAGNAKIRNVKLPVGYNHVMVPFTDHLAKTQGIKDWINNYIPSEEPELTVQFKASTTNILWAADVWHSIKKYWCLEVQRLILARRNMKNGV